MEVPLGAHILHLAETGSTNADAMRLAVKGEPLPLWIVADRQSAGRGRSGRTWESPAGNLYTSVAFCCDAATDAASQLSLVAGIALFDAVSATTHLAREAGLRLKWPNDVLVGRAKMGGILVESTTARGSPGFLAVIGFGLNIEAPPPGLEQTATAIAHHTSAPHRNAVFPALAAKTKDWLDAWDNGANFASIRQEWMKRAGALGEPVTVHAPDGSRLSGTYRGLSETGALLAEIDGAARQINHGDVMLGGSAVPDGDV
ncbi:biotin--[acetyl-CoA-carboxylase] ligase [Hyphomicrobium methylovorum]|uniref:biotin--[acetyl-CoA-carboxylase] ligase n=1 Tax=Hyphomicrobium methylovorum TaxID=84 RepID=UPI0015E6FFA8|nr:biotin--[acetyl-CoA-carboxylase] ligase [Hyphomicrobium methylovorum]MBA2125137.1 biotin--[acetyl-CoA-carboxylase] ligase [Hyphomicrobium methylovorum]